MWSDASKVTCANFRDQFFWWSQQVQCSCRWTLSAPLISQGNHRLVSVHVDRPSREHRRVSLDIPLHLQSRTRLTAEWPVGRSLHNMCPAAEITVAAAGQTAGGAPLPLPLQCHPVHANECNIIIRPIHNNCSVQLVVNSRTTIVWQSEGGIAFSSDCLQHLDYFCSSHMFACSSNWRSNCAEVSLFCRGGESEWPATLSSFTVVYWMWMKCCISRTACNIKLGLI